MDKWDRILKAENVLLDVQAKSSVAAIRELAGLLTDDDAIQNHKQFVSDVIRREQVSTTGIGHGVAVPHAHEDFIRRQILALGISKEGVNFGSMDGNPVHIIALLATPKKHHKQHMELLAGLSRLLQHDSVRESLIEAVDGQSVVEVFTSAK
jgi:fructose-specific phosphotransferase system IIA component